MSRKTSLLLIVAALIALAIGVTAGGEWLWNKLLEMHGMAPAANQKIIASSWPATRTGSIARDWVAAFNTGEEPMRRFLQANMARESIEERSIESRIGTYRDLRKRYGPLTLKGIARAEDLRLDALISGGDRKERTFSFEFHDQQQPKLRSVKITERQRHHGDGATASGRP